MNLFGRYFVKSNYIRAAKDDWVLCDVRLLTDDTDTFLCIKSLPSFDTSDAEKGNKSERNSCKIENFAARPFTALCNLSEYKSCSMRTVSVNDRASFALKLVPSGVFGNKKLFIATEDENEITAWLAVCKASLGKKAKNGINNKDNISTFGTLSKTGSFMSLKPNPQVCDNEFEEGLLDNEVYEAYSSEDKIPAILEEAGDWVKLHLSQPDCYLRLTEERLEVLDVVSLRPVHWFPYLLIRRFGAANGVLRVDAGRRCSTGDGKFFFRCSPPNGQPVEVLVTQIRQLALEAKQKMKRSQHTVSNLELQGSTNTLMKDSLGGTPDGSDAPVSSSTCGELGESVHGTLPRARTKRTKESAVIPMTRLSKSQENSNKHFEGIPPKATPEQLDDMDNLTVAGDGEVVRASPCRPEKSAPESNNSSNLYDNLPRPPRRGSRLAGAVNVLPLPVRTKLKERGHCTKLQNSDIQTTNGSTDESQVPSMSSTTVSPVTTAETCSSILTDPLSTRPSVLSRPRAPPPLASTDSNKSEPTNSNSSGTSSISSPLNNANPEHSVTSHLNDLDSKRSDMSPTSSNLLERANSSTASTTETSIKSDSPLSKSPPISNVSNAPITANTTNTSSTTVGSNNVVANASRNGTSATALQIPPLSTEKSNTNEISNAIRGSVSSYQGGANYTPEQFPMSLSRVLNYKTSSTSVFLRAPHPTTKSEISLLTNNKGGLKTNSANSSSTNRCEKPYRTETNLQKPEEKQVSTLNAYIKEDSRRYLNELDTVIRELCEANEAAVQATREAAQRRQRVGWPARLNNDAGTNNMIALQKSGTNV